MPQMNKLSSNNTAVLTKDGKTTVILHSTPVVTFDDKTITLDNGGWVTTTTAARMNQASNQYGLGYEVIRRNGCMYVDHVTIGRKSFGRTITFNR